jgi:hypothetical protein
MIARPSTPVRSANAGEFSEDVRGRVDVKGYYSAGLRYKRIEPVPQSGFRQMGGTWRKAFWRKPRAALALTAPTPLPGPHTGEAIVWTASVAFGGPAIAVEVTDFAVSDGTASFHVEIQSVEAEWVQVGGSFEVHAGTSESRLAAFAPGAARFATAVRIVASFSEEATVSIGAVAAFSETGTAIRPRYVALTTDAGTAISAFVTAGMADFYTAELGHVGAVALPAVTEAMLPDLGFYAEGNTIGIFHGQLRSVRLFLAGALNDWRRDFWPYDPPPDADLGGDYVKTVDQWEFFIRWSSDDTPLVLTFTVNGESTKSVRLATDINVATSAEWAALAADIKAALEDLPSLGPTVSVTPTEDYETPVPWPATPNASQRFVVTFHGELAGEEYQFDALVANTTLASALAYHVAIGETELEPLFSVARGWPGKATLIQDRMTHSRIKAMPGAMAFSRAAEYFDFNVKGQGDAAPRLDRLRSQTSETVLAMYESKYILAFTDRGVYFSTNRTVERNTPLNFVLTSEIGAQPNCDPFVLDNRLYYVAINPRGVAGAADGGKQLITLDYDDISTAYQAAGVSLTASHLVDRVIRTARQKPATDLDAAKGWLMRADGRLIAGQFIASQEITGYCEWPAADGGLVREIGIDGNNRLWLSIERGAEKTHELYDSAIYLDDAVNAGATDLGGLVENLPYPNGTIVYAVADGFVLGPFTVESGEIDLEDPYASVVVGRWQAPVWESMPQVHVTGNDDVVWRPGRIHTAHLNLIDTTSIAIGANGETPQDVRLARTTDPTDLPMPGRTELLTVTGEDLPGFKEGTTLVVTQTRPGRLRVRDLAMGTKL